MYKFCGKTGILFLILCGVSGLPYQDNKVENEDVELDNELSGSEVKLLNRLRRAPHYQEDMSLESRFGGRGPPFGGPHGPLGFGHPWGPRWTPPGHRHDSWRYGPPPGCKHPFVGGDGYHHDHPDPNVPFEHSPECHKNHPHFGQHPHHKHDGYYPHHPEGHPHNPDGNHHQDPSIQPGHNNLPNNIPSEPTEPFTNQPALPEPKSNNDDSTNIRPVSEPNLDVAPQNNVTTPYPQIDIRSGS